MVTGMAFGDSNRSLTYGRPTSTRKMQQRSSIPTSRRKLTALKISFAVIVGAVGYYYATSESMLDDYSVPNPHPPLQLLGPGQHVRGRATSVLDNYAYAPRSISGSADTPHHSYHSSTNHNVNYHKKKKKDSLSLEKAQAQEDMEEDPVIHPIEGDSSSLAGALGFDKESHLLQMDNIRKTRPKKTKKKTKKSKLKKKKKKKRKNTSVIGEQDEGIVPVWASKLGEDGEGQDNEMNPQSAGNLGMILDDEQPADNGDQPESDKGGADQDYQDEGYDGIDPQSANNLGMIVNDEQPEENVDQSKSDKRGADQEYQDEGDDGMDPQSADKREMIVDDEPEQDNTDTQPESDKSTDKGGADQDYEDEGVDPRSASRLGMILDDESEQVNTYARPESDRSTDTAKTTKKKKTKTKKTSKKKKKKVGALTADAEGNEAQLESENKKSNSDEEVDGEDQVEPSENKNSGADPLLEAITENIKSGKLEPDDLSPDDNKSQPEDNDAEIEPIPVVKKTKKKTKKIKKKKISSMGDKDSEDKLPEDESVKLDKDGEDTQHEVEAAEKAKVDVTETSSNADADTEKLTTGNNYADDDTVDAEETTTKDNKDGEVLVDSEDNEDNTPRVKKTTKKKKMKKLKSTSTKLMRATTEVKTDGDRDTSGGGDDAVEKDTAAETWGTSSRGNNGDDDISKDDQEPDENDESEAEEKTAKRKKKGSASETNTEGASTDTEGMEDQKEEDAEDAMTKKKRKKASLILGSEALSDFVTSTEVDEVIDNGNVSYVHYTGCCGIGHRLARMSNAYHAAQRMNFALKGTWPSCQKTNVFEHLFETTKDGFLELPDNATRSSKMVAVNNEVPGYATVTRTGKSDANTDEPKCDTCHPDKIDSDYKFYTLLMSRFRGRQHVIDFAAQHAFANHTVIGVHVRAGNGEEGDFVNKKRGITDPDEFAERVSQQIGELVRGGNWKDPPLLFLATDTAEMVETFRDKLVIPQGIPVLTLPQVRATHGEGILFGAKKKRKRGSRKAIKRRLLSNDDDEEDATEDAIVNQASHQSDAEEGNDKQVCLSSWDQAFMDMMLLAMSDVVVAARRSSFVQTAPLSIVMGKPQAERKVATPYCEISHDAALQMTCHETYMDWCCCGSCVKDEDMERREANKKKHPMEYIKQLRPDLWDKPVEKLYEHVVKPTTGRRKKRTAERETSQAVKPSPRKMKKKRGN